MAKSKPPASRPAAKAADGWPFGHALLAGLCAGLASLFAKLAELGSSSPTQMSALACAGSCLAGPAGWACEGKPGAWAQLPYLLQLLRLLSVAGFVSANGVMFAQQGLAMAKLPSEVATILNFSTSFIASALLGWAVFSEALRPKWLLGTAMMVAGLALILYGEGRERSKAGKAA